MPAHLSRSGFEERYGILDNAYLKWNNILDQSLTLSARTPGHRPG